TSSSIGSKKPSASVRKRTLPPFWLSESPLRIPYVVDNETYRLADVLNQILAEHGGKSLDVATAYFNVQGFRLLRDGLTQLGSFRLLLGDEPADGASVGLRPRGIRVLRDELDAAIFSEETLR